jgi:hypothetical protein
MQISTYVGRLVAARLHSRRARIVGALLLTPAFAAVAPGAALATSGVQCANNGTYGSQCIDVHGSGLQVTDVQSWFTPPNGNYLTNRRWNFELTTYACSPYGRPKSQCPPSHTFYSNTRTGQPPKNGSTCTSLSAGFGGGSSVGYQQCVDYGVAYADADFGDWPSFYAMPHTFGSTTYICTEIAVWNGSRWVDNGAAGSTGVRACATVHS